MTKVEYEQGSDWRAILKILSVMLSININIIILCNYVQICSRENIYKLILNTISFNLIFN